MVRRRRSQCAVCALAPTTTSGLSRRTRPLEVSDVTRSSVTLSWLAPTSNGGATIVAHGIEQSRAPVTDVVSADDRLHGRQPDRAVLLPIPHLRRKRRDLPDRRLSDRFHGRRLTVAVTIRIRPVQSYSLFAYMPAVTFSFRHRTFSESKLVTFTSLRLCRHAYNANNIWTVCQFS